MAESKVEHRFEAVKQRLRELEHSLLSGDELSEQESQQRLQQRAEQLARVPHQDQDADNDLEIVLFRLGDQRYAIATEFVTELARPLEITPVPHTDPHFTGLFNLRGDVTLVVDLCRLFGITSTGRRGNQVLVVGRTQAEFGIAVDEIEYVTSLRQDKLIHSQAGGACGELIQGCTGDVILIDGVALLACEELYIEQLE